MESFVIQWVLPLTIVMLASVIQGITGFGSGLVSMALLPLIWSIPHAVGVLSPIGVILTIMLTYKLRSHFQLKEVTPLLLPMPIGVLGGVWILEHWPNIWMKAFLGTILIVYVSASGRLGRAKLSPHPLPAALAGLIGGVCGGAFSASGPPVLIYATAVGWSRDKFRANLQVFFMSTAILGLFGFINLGLITRETLPITAACLPGVLLGGLFGNHLATRLPQEKFRKIVMLGLMAMGSLYVLQWILSLS